MSIRTAILICALSCLLLSTQAAGSATGKTAHDTAGLASCPALSGDTKAPISYLDLIRCGEAFRERGRFPEAAASFQAAREKGTSPRQKAVALLGLGNTALFRRDFTTAEPLFREALEIGEEHGPSALVALCHNSLGNLLSSRKLIAEASRAYQRALETALKANDLAAAATARLNLAKLLRDLEPDRALQLLGAVLESAPSLPDAGERAAILLAVGHTALSHDSTEERMEQWRTTGGAALALALPLAQQSNDARLLSRIHGEQAGLALAQQRLPEAERLTEYAIHSAAREQAHDLLLQWEWQLGRILKSQGRLRPATDAFRRSVSHIDAIRHDIPIEYHDGRSSFRETLAPVYLGLADLLLQLAEHEKDEARHQALLIEARDAVERIKTAEMQDFFKDSCAVTQRVAVQLEKIDLKSAILYPILLPDRLELLLSLPGGWQRAMVPVGARELEKVALRFVQALRAPITLGRVVPFPEEDGRRLYDWLIKPLASSLAHTETIVIVPDGVLRLVPFSAMVSEDGQFLVQRYAVATSPGLTLFDPAPIPREDMTTLIAGLSRPGPVVKELPQRQLSEQFAKLRGQGLLRGGEELRTAAAMRDLLDEPGVAQKVSDSLALPGIDTEVKDLAGRLSATVLMNESFNLNDFESQVLKTPYRIVHIASHGVFGGTAEESFILTYDRLLTMHTFENLLKNVDKNRAVELLSLSACQTAEGNDRAPLGLSGVALKSGARSAMGTLWPAEDRAAQQLFAEFYRQLTTENRTKAQALRTAQLKLLGESATSHPFFWSPFILIGNWL